MLLTSLLLFLLPVLIAPLPNEKTPVEGKNYGGGGAQLPPPEAVPPQKGDYFPPLNTGGGDGPYDPQGQPDGGGVNIPPGTGVGGGDCLCVPYYQCNEGKVVEDGSGLLDARQKPPPAQEIPLDETFSDAKCGPFHVCCTSPSVVTERPFEAHCGVRNPGGINSRVLTKGVPGEAEFGEWPWQAAVLKVENEILHFQCGGTLISSRHVLTVAHCVAKFLGYDRAHLKIRLGEWDTQSMKEFLPHEDYDVGQISIHPYFKNTSLWNDLAVLELSHPVRFAPNIAPICLPSPGEAFEGHDCVVTGWGKDAYRDGGTYSNIMKEVAVPVIDNYNCQELLRRTRLGHYFRLHEGFLCAGGEEGQDSCKGDGGGPLSCYRQQNGRYVLAGLVAWGIDCGSSDVPGVYVRIPKYLDWISSVTGVPLEEFWPNNVG